MSDAGFAAWQTSKALAERADRQRRRVKAKLLAKRNRKPPPPPPEEAVRIAVALLKLRIGCDLDSRECGEIAVGTMVRVLERQRLADGATRVKVAAHPLGAPPHAALGWCTSSKADGSEKLPEVGARALANVPAGAAAASWLASLESAQEQAVEAAWLASLGDQRFRVCRMKETEDAHSGELTEFFAPGTYACVACSRTLYTAEHKFHTTSGWPSFSDSVGGALLRVVAKKRSTSFGGGGKETVEIRCASCGSHVGHVYEGSSYPPPHHERHCANSASLRFVAAPAVAAADAMEVVAPAPAAAPSPAACTEMESAECMYRC